MHIALSCNLAFLITLKRALGLCWSPLTPGWLTEAMGTAEENEHDENDRLPGAFIKSQNTGNISGYKEIFALF